MTDSTYDPYLYRSVDKPISNFGAFTSLITCVIGTGVLAIPLAFSFSGTLLGIFLLIVTAILLIHGIQLIVICMVECSRRMQIGYASYPDAMVYSFSQGPKCFRYFSRASGYLADVVLCFSHYGICVVYLVFVASNVKTVMDDYESVADIRYYIAFTGLLSIPIFSIIHLKFLIPINLLANVLLYIGFAMIFYYLFENLPPFSNDQLFVGDSMKLPLFFGIILFSISSVGVMLAIESKMATPQNFIGWFGVLDLSAIVVVISYITFAIFGYWRYGGELKASITLNLPSEPLAHTAQIVFAFDVFLSFPLCGFVVIDIIMTHYWNKSGNLKRAKTKEIILRICFVLVATLNAIAFPGLGPLLALTGAFTISLLNLVFPALLEICLYYPEEFNYGRFKWKLVKDIIMMIFGVLILVQGTVFAIKDMIDFYGQ
ncbi:glutamate transporter polyphemus-like [Drosophila rhopaloa]|uniref:Proton-coupled amino acid transporter 3-like n=1 Tax=Drosophila rhopaloa TaxID=1041015 RepID=A0A6P4FUV1_DRORH|nr:glutamate transporter polyphemus-like [Drosophila rhopaloa]